MIFGNAVIYLNSKIIKLIGLAAIRSLPRPISYLEPHSISLKNSLGIALVVTNKCLC